jgi:hypothetical protein
LAVLPFPFAGLPVIAGDAALNHFIAPLIARHDEGSEVAGAEAERADVGSRIEDAEGYTSKGVGSSIVAVRINCLPENTLASPVARGIRRISARLVTQVILKA